MVIDGRTKHFFFTNVLNFILLSSLRVIKQPYEQYMKTYSLKCLAIEDNKKRFQQRMCSKSYIWSGSSNSEASGI